MNIEKQVLYISLIFQFQFLLFLFYILELTMSRSNSLLHNPTFHFNLIVVEPA